MAETAAPTPASSSTSAPTVPGPRTPTDPLQAAVTRVGRHWGLLLAYAATTLVLGIMVLAWPGATLVVAAVLFAVQLLAGGVVNIVQAIATDEASGGQRALLAVLGAFAVLVGLLALRSPLQTLAAMALIIGAWWLASGLVEVVAAFGRDVPHRVWKALGGLVSVVAGIVVLTQPAMSLATLVLVLGIWLVVEGLVLAVAALTLRRAASRTITVP